MRALQILFVILALGLPSLARGQADASSGLQPGDAIRLTIWREPDMSGEILVQENGMAVFPRLGPVAVVGRDAETLKQEILAEYSKTLLNPSIEIIFIRRVAVSGEVRSPGVFRVDPSTTLTETLALAGGTTPNARRDRILLIRDGVHTTIDFNKALTVGDLAIQSGDQIYVPERSWLARNWMVPITLLSSLGYLYAILTN